MIAFLLNSFNWHWMPKYLNPTSMKEPLSCFSILIISTKDRRKPLLLYKKEVVMSEKLFWSCLCGIATVKQDKQTLGRWLDMPTTHNHCCFHSWEKHHWLIEYLDAACTSWNAQRLQQRFHFYFTWNLPFVPFELIREKLNVLIYYTNI